MPTKRMFEMNMIVAFCRNMGIGYKNSIPWSIPEDLVRFEKMTKGHVVVMGRKTYDSLPEAHRPLKDRLNVVVTRNPCLYANENNDVVFLTGDELDAFLGTLQDRYMKCFIIGGETIYRKYIGKCEYLHVTYIDKEYDVDTKFPHTDSLFHYELTDVSPLQFAVKENCTYRYLTYHSRDNVNNHADITYLTLLKELVDQNKPIRTDRTGTGTISVFARQMRFDISNTIPLLTTKYVPWKMVVKELLWFLQGKTDAKLLKQLGVNIWNGNTTRDFLDKRGLSNYEEGDIGPMYGFQWRHFGAVYEGCNSDYNNKGIDQLKSVLNLLRIDPYSRRILMTTVNVMDLEKGCLHPCHGIVVQFYVTDGENGEKHLSCHMYQRSVDTFLGLTWNILSYAILTHIIALQVGMKPAELIISTGDTHLYHDHIEQAKEQLKRSPYPLPKLLINESVKNKDIDDLTVDDFEIVGYFHHSAIKAKMSV